MPSSLVKSIAVASACSWTLMSPQARAAEDDVLQALESFIAAFEDGDIETMEASFSPDAVTFPRSIMSREYDGDIEISKYRRVRGIDPQMRELIESKPTTDIDYVAIVDAETLQPVDVLSNKVLVALVVFVGKTRLIDNVMLSPYKRG